MCGAGVSDGSKTLGNLSCQHFRSPYSELNVSRSCEIFARLSSSSKRWREILLAISLRVQDSSKYWLKYAGGESRHSGYGTQCSLSSWAGARLSLFKHTLRIRLGFKNPVWTTLHSVSHGYHVREAEGRTYVSTWYNPQAVLSLELTMSEDNSSKWLLELWTPM